MGVRSPKHKSTSPSSTPFYAAFHTPWKVVSHPVLTECFLVLYKRRGFPCSPTSIMFPSCLPVRWLLGRNSSNSIFLPCCDLKCLLQRVLLTALWKVCASLLALCVHAAGGMFSLAAQVSSATSQTFPLTLITEVPKIPFNWSSTKMLLKMPVVIDACLSVCGLLK